MNMFECQVCYEEFSPPSIKPLNLNCGHTLCSNCVRNIVSYGSPKCPFCKKSQSSNLADFPINYVYLNLIQEKITKAAELAKSTLYLSDGQYQGETNASGKRHGYGVMEFIDGRSYNGQFENNLFQGKGCLTFADGSFIMGTFLNNKPHGFCSSTLKMPKYIKYEGMFFNGRPHGKGIGYLTENTYEEGIFVNGSLLHTVPSFICTENSISIGYNNQGTYEGAVSYFNGNVYKGKLGADHLPNGPGFQYDMYGNIVIGVFNKDGAFGTGEIKFKNGDNYKGELNRNLMNGEGTLMIGKNTNYVGGFANGFREGFGVFSYCSKSEGNEEDIYKYEGEWVRGKKEGFGTEKINGIVVYIGKFKNDLRNGTGRLFMTDSQYDGAFLDGMRHGNGVVIKNGKSTKVYYEKDEDKTSSCVIF